MNPFTQFTILKLFTILKIDIEAKNYLENFPIKDFGNDVEI